MKIKYNISTGNTSSLRSIFFLSISLFVYIFGLAESASAGTTLTEIRKLMDDATTKTKTNVTYIVVGDSTRDSIAVPHKYWYKKILEQFNINYYHSAASGLRATNWVTGAYLTNAVAAATGTNGNKTIIEISIGSNDMNAYPPEQVKANVKFCITELQRLLPESLIFLVNPVRAARVSVTPNGDVLKQIYIELSEELSVPMINKDSVLKEKYEDVNQRVKFFYDNVHPNYFGAIRLLDYVMLTITGEKSKKIYHRNPHIYADISAAPANLAEGVNVVTGVWNTTSGTLNTYPYLHEYRALEEIPVIGNILLKVEHSGNSDSVCVKDAVGNPMERFGISRLRDPQDLNNTQFHYLYLPPDAATVGINISSHGSDWDTNHTPIVVSYITNGVILMHNSEIFINDPRNKGFLMSVSKNSTIPAVKNNLLYSLTY